jgi:hypothetical protein
MGVGEIKLARYGEQILDIVGQDSLREGDANAR